MFDISSRTRGIAGLSIVGEHNLFPSNSVC